MRRLPVRWRLTLAFALVMACVLAATGFFVSERNAASLDSALQDSLRAQAAGLAALAQQSDSGLAEARGTGIGDGRLQLAQLISPSGQVIDATPNAPANPLLPPATLTQARHGAAFFESASSGGQPVRLLAIPIAAQGQRLLGIVGQSLAPRDRATADLTNALLIGGSLALLLSTAAGYFLAGVALRPVEALRRRERAFVAEASHELRSPLTMLRTELELMGRDRPSGGELEAATDSAIEEAERLCVLVDDLLLLSRTDEGRVTLRRAAIPARELAADAVERAQRRLARPLRVEAIDSAEPRFVRADRDSIGRAIDNLLDNAMRYASREVLLEVRGQGTAVELHVLDDGPGFPPSFLPRAWERFSRADEARTEGGAGLGLSIVRTIAELHGGKVGASNRPEGGADVWIALPAASVPAAPPARTSAAPVSG